jgi:glycosyltransferase involved in cell wall biosynthesis
MASKKILFFCGTPPHPIHKEIAERINADFYYFPDTKSKKEKLQALRNIPNDYDIYFAEGLFGYLYLAKKLRFIPKGAKLMNLFSDPRLYQLTSGTKFNFTTQRPEKYPSILKSYQKRAIQNLDYALCIGDYQSELLREIYPSIKIIQIPPMIEREEFFTSTPSRLETENIFFLGGGPDYNYKGLDFLLNVCKKVIQKNSKVHLYIVGGNWGKFIEKNHSENIHFVGTKNTQELIEILQNSSLCCHFARGEATGISILEAMCMQIPCMVSDQTGAKQYVPKEYKKYIKKFSEEEEIVEEIINYFTLSREEREEIGSKFRKEALKLTKENFFEKLDQGMKEVYI